MGRVVRWEAGWKREDFLDALFRAGGMVPGAVVDVQCRHADGCRKPEGGACRCEPEVVATIYAGGEA